MRARRYLIALLSRILSPAPLLLVAGAPALLQAEALPSGGEFQINSYTNADQYDPSVAIDPTGRFVVVWRSDQDGSSSGIFAQRFDSRGAMLDSEFQVNTFTPGVQYTPDVATDPRGDFTVVWTSREQEGSPGEGVFGQLYDGAGMPIGGELQINTYTTGAQRRPSVAADENGNIVVVWQSQQDGSSTGIFGQRLDGAAMPLGSEFQVNSFTEGVQYEPSVASRPGGAFVVAWEGAGNGDNDGIFFRRFDSTGAAEGDQFQANIYTTGFQEEAVVATDAAGNFTIVWNSVERDGYDGGIFGRRFASDGTPVGGEFHVNTYTVGDQRAPDACEDAAGNLVIVWSSSGPVDAVFGQRYDGGGTAKGPNFRVDGYASEKGNATVACTAAGDFVVGWDSSRQDGSDRGIFGQRFARSRAPVPLLTRFSALVLAIALLALGVAAVRRFRAG